MKYSKMYSSMWEQAFFLSPFLSYRWVKPGDEFGTQKDVEKKIGQSVQVGERRKG